MLLTELITEGELPYEIVTDKLMISTVSLKNLATTGVIRIETFTQLRNPIKSHIVIPQSLQLSEEQQKIINEIIADYKNNTPDTYLIHGITGSGKTQVYICLIEEIVKLGKQAIVLIPEIALTYQTVIRFYRHFGDRVSILNSSLSPSEKYDQCERAKQGEIDIIIGPRSALFTPFPNIGLIVIDEEHEGSYKSESTPRYHARETALEIARMHSASVVLGSATPSLESYYQASEGNYKLFRLTNRLTGGTLPTVYTIDLREELRKGNRSIFSIKLQDVIQ